MYKVIAIWLAFVITSLYFFPNILSSVVFSTYIGTGHRLDLATAFTCLVFFDIIKDPIRQLPLFISSFIQFKVSMNRIQRYIDITEVPFECLVNKQDVSESNPAISITSSSFSWGIKI